MGLQNFLSKVKMMGLRTQYNEKCAAAINDKTKTAYVCSNNETVQLDDVDDVDVSVNGYIAVHSKFDIILYDAVKYVEIFKAEKKEDWTYTFLQENVVCDNNCAISALFAYSDKVIVINNSRTEIGRLTVRSEKWSKVEIISFDDRYAIRCVLSLAVLSRDGSRLLCKRMKDIYIGDCNYSLLGEDKDIICSLNRWGPSGDLYLMCKYYSEIDAIRVKNILPVRNMDLMYTTDVEGDTWAVYRAWFKHGPTEMPVYVVQCAKTKVCRLFPVKLVKGAGSQMVYLGDGIFKVDTATVRQYEKPEEHDKLDESYLLYNCKNNKVIQVKCGHFGKEDELRHYVKYRLELQKLNTSEDLRHYIPQYEVDHYEALLLTWDNRVKVDLGIELEETELLELTSYDEPSIPCYMRYVYGYEEWQFYHAVTGIKIDAWQEYV